MNKQKETLRLILTTDLSNRSIGRSMKLSHNTVNRYRQLSKNNSLDFAALNRMDDADIENILNSAHCRVESKQMPDWSAIHREMQYRGVTLSFYGKNTG